MKDRNDPIWQYSKLHDAINYALQAGYQICDYIGTTVAYRLEQKPGTEWYLVLDDDLKYVWQRNASDNRI